MVRYNLLHSLSMTNATTRTCTRAGWLMIALEAWAFDVGQILAAYLDVVSLGAHSALQTLTGFTYMSFPLALSIAVAEGVRLMKGPQAASNASRAAMLSIHDKVETTTTCSATDTQTSAVPSKALVVSTSRQRGAAAAPS